MRLSTAGMAATLVRRASTGSCRAAIRTTGLAPPGARMRPRSTLPQAEQPCCLSAHRAGRGDENQDGPSFESAMNLVFTTPIVPRLPTLVQRGDALRAVTAAGKS